MKILTIKNFQDLLDLKYTGDVNSEIDANTIAILSDTPSEVIKKMKPTDYMKFKENLLKQAVSGLPVTMFRYKGKLFGYEPPELDTVEAMAAMEVFLNTKNWNAMAALMFREVKPITRWWWRNKKHFTKRYGIEVKEMKNAAKDRLQYSTKKLNFEQVDLDFWNDFPVNILLSNLTFSMGSGLVSSLSFPVYSQPSEKLQQVKKEAMMIAHQLVTSILLQRTVLGLECLKSTIDPAFWTSNPENSSTGWSIWVTNKLKKTLKSFSWQLTGDKKANIIDNYETFLNNLANGEMKANDLSLLSSIGTLNKQEAKIGLLYG